MRDHTDYGIPLARFARPSPLKGGRKCGSLCSPVPLEGGTEERERRLLAGSAAGDQATGVYAAGWELVCRLAGYEYGRACDVGGRLAGLAFESVGRSDFECAEQNTFALDGCLGA